jgi:hypothetical protein
VEKLPHYYFSLVVCFQKYIFARSFLRRQNNPEVNHFPLRTSGVGVFLREMSSSRCYSKKDCKEKKQQHSYRTGTWNVRTLNRAVKLENLKKEVQKNKVSVLGVCEVR